MEVTIPKLRNGNRFIAFNFFDFRPNLNTARRASYVDSFRRCIDAKDCDCAPDSPNFENTQKSEGRDAACCVWGVAVKKQT
jgi:hypothetical protein